jgi:hypothetical protein
VADDVRKLLDHIVKSRIVHDDLVAIDLEASASDQGSAIESSKQRIARREAVRAADLAKAFGRGVTRVRAGEAVFDDRDADQNLQVDALIQFLVRADLASSTADQTEPNHYSYRIRIDWPKLQSVAAEAGVDLDDAIRPLT